MSYRRVNDYRWEFYPPPYGFASPVPRLVDPGSIIPPGGGSSLGLGGCGCGCGGHCRGGGLSGVFGSTFDAPISEWGVEQWATAGIAGGIAIFAVQALAGLAKEGRRRGKVRRIERRLKGR
jgi:hypothetical protein